MKSSPVPGFLAISAIALILYLPFLAIQYDTNGIIEAQGVESGQLIPHNHILYRPIGWMAYHASTALGYSGNSLTILQVLDAILGAAAIGLLYLALDAVVQHRLAAAGGSLWLATSFLYWYASTDVDYVILAALFSAASLAVLLRGKGGISAAVSGLFLALAVLTWQANVFFLVGLLLLSRMRQEWRRTALALGVTGLTAGSVYLSIGIAFYSVRDPRDFLAWIFRYGTGATLSMWGAWDLSRIPEAAWNALRSLVPVLLMAGPAEILTFRVKLGRLAADAGGISLAVLLILAAVWAAAWSGTRLSGKRRFAALAFLAGYAAFLPFIVWWDPGEPKWFVVPNILLAGFLTISWDSQFQRREYRALFLGCIGLIAAANFVTTFRPRHQRLSPERRIAQCVSNQMAAADLVIAAEWGWPDYLGYLHGHQALNLINESIPFGADKPAFLAMVRERIRMTQRNGGKVITPDPAQYPAAHLQWLQAQTGIVREDLEALGASPASRSFVCEDRSMAILATPAPGH